ncbi:MAG: dimethylargininase [Acidimicrobiia bacterium]|nr:dimethylargininase [Acidimicrobiia bacterium]
MAPWAVLRAVPDSFRDCLTRRPADPPLDPMRARRQHQGYRALLESGGFSTRLLPADEAHPDCCFIEDTAVLVGEAALATRPGHASRRGEVAPVAAALAAILPVRVMESPATLDGGDVLRVGQRLFVGESERTNAAGREALARFAAPYGFAMVAVPITGVLHLKSAATALDESTVLVFPGAVSPDAFAGLRVVAAEGDDPEAANVVRLPDTRILVAAHLPQSAAAVHAAGFTPVPCEVSELARADGGLTCLSIRRRAGLATAGP